MLKLEASQESDATKRPEVDRFPSSHPTSDDHVVMSPSTNIQSHEKPAFSKFVFSRAGLVVSQSFNGAMSLRATVEAPGKMFPSQPDCVQLTLWL